MHLAACKYMANGRMLGADLLVFWSNDPQYQRIRHMKNIRRRDVWLEDIGKKDRLINNLEIMQVCKLNILPIHNSEQA